MRCDCRSPAPSNIISLHIDRAISARHSNIVPPLRHFDLAMDRQCLGRDAIELILEYCAPRDAAFFAFTCREVAWAADYDLMVYDDFFYCRHNPDHCRLCLWLLRDFEPGECRVCHSSRLCADCIVPVWGYPRGRGVCWWCAGPEWDHLLPRRHLNLRRRFTTAWWYLIREDLD